MPSSMCWPAGDSLHCTGCGTSANASFFTRGNHTPLRLIHPARWVVTATSAETVTMWSDAGVRPSALRTRPNASCVDVWPVNRSSRRSGTSGSGRRGGGALKGRGSARINAASALVSGKRAHSSPAAMPSSSRSASICAVVISVV